MPFRSAVEVGIAVLDVPSQVIHIGHVLGRVGGGIFNGVAITHGDIGVVVPAASLTRQGKKGTDHGDGKHLDAGRLVDTMGNDRLLGACARNSTWCVVMFHIIILWVVVVLVVLLCLLLMSFKSSYTSEDLFVHLYIATVPFVVNTHTKKPTRNVHPCGHNTSLAELAHNANESIRL